MGLILSLETSASTCSAALHQSEQLISYSELRKEKSHAAFITILIEDVLKHAGAELNQLNAVALSGGPGSYTGLRIGAATAKGLCFALDIPLIEVSTLAALALAQITATPNQEEYWYCPMVDARRMEVYAAVYNNELQTILPIAPVILTKDTLAEQLSQQPIIFFGSGAAKFNALLENSTRAHFVDRMHVSAREIGSLAFPKWEKHEFVDLAYYEPYYLKEFYTTAKLA
jgi:tRNA threonylcarbamoyladenosine biosynthesis protein TsaB